MGKVCKIDKMTITSARTPVSTLPPDLALLERSRSHLHTKHPPHLFNSGPGQRFCEDVCWHAFGWDVMHINQTCLDNIPEPVVAQIQVFHAPMMLRIPTDCKSRLVVQVQRRRALDFEA